ncbi:MAG TPA: ATP-grasp domain-containing protein [Pirellulales bacterium]|nr:ATP-grasp domain-containing protein [Pirellulales bacterium]
MPRIFIYEFTTGGGLLALNQDAPLARLVDEGRAMVTALAADFAAIDGVEVKFLADRRLTAGRMDVRRAHVVGDYVEANATFDRLAAAADWTVVIAPETNGHLVGTCRRVVELGGRLLGPPPELVALASDKQATAQHLAAAGVRVPRGIAWAMGPPWPDDIPYPAVWKPRDGAGSQGLRYVPDSKAIRKPVESDVTPLWDGRPSEAKDGPGRPSHVPREGRLERYCPGLPVSVASLCGPQGLTTLAPCLQLLSDDGCFRYLGGVLIMEPALAERATKLAAEAVASLPQPRGYLGVDLVLGPETNGDTDFVIEINPRLTTSYVGLRAACESNLADAMLAIARGQAPAIHFRNEPLRFTADGKIVRMTPVGDS